MSQVFVFGSNLAGIHGAGAAKEAYHKHGAVWRIGHGRQGNSYAIPTRNARIATLALISIKIFVEGFCVHASLSQEDEFFVTRINCGLTRLKNSDIAPMFKSAPSNCTFPIEWKPYLDDDATRGVKFHDWETRHQKKA